MMGKVIMSGIVPQLVAPKEPGIQASELAVGSTVKLMENGASVEYLVVNQGVPGNSSLYDGSCDGLWLLRKDAYATVKWHSSNSNSYKASTIHTYLNGTFFNRLGSVEQTVIQQVKIPYVNGTGGRAVASGTNGLSTKVFLLSGYEIGFTTSTWDEFPVDGAKLDYFESGDNSGSSARSKRKAYLNGTTTQAVWYLRSPRMGNTTESFYVTITGSFSYQMCTAAMDIRPALILPSTALFDEETLILKGVA